MKILLTGGAGYIGSHTVVELLNRDYEVMVIDNLSNSSEESLRRVERITGKKVPFVKGDLCDYNVLEKLFSENTFDSVIHFAGLKAVGESVKLPLKYYENNLVSTLNLIKVMSKYNCKKLVFSSSATVYGTPERLPLDEDCALSTTNPYGATKLMIENILRDIFVGDASWNITLLRYFNPVGAHKSGLIGEDPQGIPNNLTPYIAGVACGKLECLSVFGNDYDTPDGTGVRDYIHVVDLAIGHIKAIEKMNSAGVHTFNLGTGIGYSVLDVVKAFEKASGKTVKYKICPRRAGDIASCYAKADKAKAELGWEAKLGIDDMCASLWNWQSHNPNGYKS